MPTAAGVMIGDEILTGKIRDTNVHLLIDTLHAAGVVLRRLATIRDEVDEIADEVRRCAASFDHVFTSGGIGPTHDDRTIEGVARAFGCAVVRDPRLEALVRQHWRERINDAALRLADVPEGSRLIAAEEARFPVVVCRNVCILPGIPQLFAAKLALVARELHGTPPVLQSIYLSGEESAIAAALTQVVGEVPAVCIGSYPRIGDPDHRIRITVEGPERAAVERAMARLLELLPAELVIRVER
jgi:molybdenum cofactor synthesis domain-containing protein